MSGSNINVCLPQFVQKYPHVDVGRQLERLIKIFLHWRMQLPWACSTRGRTPTCLPLTILLSSILRIWPSHLIRCTEYAVYSVQNRIPQIIINDLITWEKMFDYQPLHMRKRSGRTEEENTAIGLLCFYFNICESITLGF